MLGCLTLLDTHRLPQLAGARPWAARCPQPQYPTLQALQRRIRTFDNGIGQQDNVDHGLRRAHFMLNGSIYADGTDGRVT